jgi:hypothetical protein
MQNIVDAAFPQVARPLHVPLHFAVEALPDGRAQLRHLPAELLVAQFESSAAIDHAQRGDALLEELIQKRSITGTLDQTWSGGGLYARAGI